MSFPDAVQIVDLFHAKQHLWDDAKAVYGPGTDTAERWAKRRRDEGRDEARRCIGYVRRNRHRMQYQKFRAMGLCVGSGVVEAAVVEETAALIGSTAAGGDFAALEAAARTCALEAAVRVVETRCNGDRSDERSWWACACGARARLAGRRAKRFVTVLGPVTLERAYYCCPLPCRVLPARPGAGAGRRKPVPGRAADGGIGGSRGELQGGMHWTVAGGNSIIALRCCKLSNRYPDFWARRSATG